MTKIHIALLATVLGTVGLACDRDEPKKTEPVAKTTAPAAPAKTAADKPAAAAPTPEVAKAEPTPPPELEQPEQLAMDNERVIEIAAAARELQDTPEDVDAVLQRHGLDRPAFETAVTEIAKDPWMSDLYIAALGKPTQG